MLVLVHFLQYIGLFWHYEKEEEKTEKHLKNIALYPFLDFCQDFQVQDQ
jgi:hypothetical protein